MKPPEIKAALEKMLDDAWRQRDMDAAYAVYADEIVFQRPPFPPVTGLEANLAADKDMLAAFSAIELEVNEIVVEGDTAVVQWTWSGKHTGTLQSLGLPATGKAVVLPGCSIYRFAGDRMVEQWEYSDLLGFMQQLDLIPAFA